MSKKVLILLSLVLVFSWTLSAGQVEILKPMKHGQDIRTVKAQTEVRHTVYNHRDVADTLVHATSWGSMFIQSPGDAMIVVYQMPADGYIKGVNVPIVEWGTGDQQMTVGLYNMTYPVGADGTTTYPVTVVDGNGWIGGYDMDAAGHMVFDGTTYTPGGTEGICTPGTYVAANSADPLGTVEAPFGPPGIPKQGLAWPDGFTAATLDPTNNPAEQDNWINTADFGTEPFYNEGDWVGILVFFSGAGGGDDEATGFYYTGAAALGLNNPWVAMKFYAGCGGTSGNGGWHIRNWVFDFELAVLLTGDRAPTYGDEASLTTTLSTGTIDYWIEIFDDNPSGGAAGVASATLHYQLDSTTAAINDVALTAAGDVYSGQIPGQVPGTMVYYWVEATDVEGNVSETPAKSYFIFEATPGNMLVFNNTAPLYGNPVYVPYLYYEWGTDTFDIWDATYGNITAELVNNYTVVTEVTSQGGGADFNSDPVLQPWFRTGGKTYVVEGDEWLGARYGWPSSPLTIPTGDFARDVGVDVYYPDINGSSSGISRLHPIAGDPVGGPMATFLTDSSCVLDYDPVYDPGHSNWLDGIDAASGVNVAYQGEDGEVDDAGVSSGTTTYTAGIYHQTGFGSQAAFFAFDIMSLYARNYTDTLDYWVGAWDYDDYLVSPFHLALDWAAGVTGVDNEVLTPYKFALQGNYPNPFNPSTSIGYSLDLAGKVEITVYSLLGQEIATLYSGNQTPGIHSVQWFGLDNQGRAVASGLYIYRVKSGDRALTGKMMLLK